MAPPEIATTKKLLPFGAEAARSGHGAAEGQRGRPPTSTSPDLRELLDEIIPRFTARQVYQAILESQASGARRTHGGHAQRHGPTRANSRGAYELQYNKMRQQTITNDILDIVGGAERGCGPSA